MHDDTEEASELWVGEGLGDNRVGAVGFVAMMVPVEMASRPWAPGDLCGNHLVTVPATRGCANEPPEPARCWQRPVRTWRPEPCEATPPQKRPSPSRASEGAFLKGELKHTPST